MRSTYCVVGIGEARIGHRPESSSMALALEAAQAALEDAGLERRQIDGIISDPPFNDPTFLYTHQIAENLGIRPTYASSTGLGGAGSVAALGQAAAAIECGFCTAVLFALGENASTQHRHSPAHHGILNWGYSDYEEPFGLVGPPAAYALGARRHIHEYGTRPEHFGEVALGARFHAARNDNAQKQSPLSLDDYLNSPWIVEPFRLLDCSLISDFGGAFIVVSAERARDLRGLPVAIRGVTQYHPHRYVFTAESLTHTGARRTAQKLYEETGLGPADIDVAELYDSFTYTTLVQLEDYGFCAKGEAGPFVEGGGIRLGGRLPVNTHGGLLSQGHANGVLHVTEAVRQLRGACADRQVENASVALVTGAGGILLAAHSAALLEKC